VPARLARKRETPARLLSEKPGAEIEPIGQAQNEHEQRGGCEQGEMLENERAGRDACNNGFLCNGHDYSIMKMILGYSICGARIKRRDPESNY
jgi:hypothetical protein